ncbi:dnajc [Salix suchowensis]|nr:dnajc [Salix suchowensis]
MSLAPKPLLHRLVILLLPFLLSSFYMCFNELPRIYTFRVPTRYHLQKSKSPSSNLSHFRRLCSVTGDNNVRFLVHRILTKKIMTMKCVEEFKEIWDFWNIILWAFEYCYYLTTFLLVWFYVAPAPGKMGYLAAAERFLKVMAMVWAGSQVTKLVRAGGIRFLKEYLLPRALALAPFVDRGLSWFTGKFKFESQEKVHI